VLTRLSLFEVDPAKNSIHEQLPLLYQRKIKLRAGTHGEDHRDEDFARASAGP
jgi:hypothetical protein